MSTKTFFKRAALVVVASLGLGFLSVPSSQAAVSTASITLGSATATASIGDTATGTWTVRFVGDNQASTGGDSVIVKYGCDAPALASCPSLQVNVPAAADSANALVQAGRNNNWTDISSVGWGESATSASPATTFATNGSPLSVRATASFKATGFTKAGTYTYTMFLYSNVTSSQALVSGYTPVTWTVTVSALNTAAASIKTSYFAPTNAQADYWRYGTGVPYASSTDSSIVVAAGKATTNSLAGVLMVVPANSAGDTRVAFGNGFVPVQDTFTASITGAGVLSANGGTTLASSVTMNVSSYGTSRQYNGESVTVYTNGSVGTGTITITNSSGAVLLTKTITFTGVAASAGVSLSDTYTYYGIGTVNFVAQVKDAGGNLLNSGTMYVFSSDTKVVSAGASLYSNAATQYQTLGACSATWSLTAKTLTCPLTVGDSGTASIYLADSWNVTASSFVTTALTLTVAEAKPSTVTLSFDKATYAPGEVAVLTITGTDYQGRLLASNGTTGMTGVFSKVVTTPEISYSSNYMGTQGTTGNSIVATSLAPYNDSGVETRVVVMPSFGADVTYSVTFNKVGVGNTVASATAKVVDPSQTAQSTAIANAQAAADAATDAALQAIDAANAATDAANLAAEAADAATVAAQESKDAADAATAAVESLATQVATLMAALQAQITSLANVVAKIAKKVKA